MKLNDYIQEDRELKRNGSGYYDPTAYEAIKRCMADEEYERYRRFIGCIFRICELSGYHIEERLVVKDMKTGRIFK